MLAGFEEFQVKHVPRVNNNKADILSKLANINNKCKYLLVLQRELSTLSTKTNKCMLIESRRRWMTPIKHFLKTGDRADNAKKRL